MDKKGWFGQGNRLAVMGVFVLLIMVMTGCSLSTGGDKSNTTPAAPPTSATLPVQQTPITAGGDQVVYLVAQEGGTGPIGPIGCESYLVPVVRTPVLPGTVDQQITAALTDLFSIKDQFYGESGLYNALYQSNLAVNTVQVDGIGHATIDLAGTYLLGGVCDNPVFQGQIEYTARQFPGVSGVSVLINGVPIETVLSGQ